MPQLLTPQDKLPSSRAPAPELERFFLWLLRRVLSATATAVLAVGQTLAPEVGVETAERMLRPPHAAAVPASEQRGIMEQGFDASLYKQLVYRGDNLWQQLRSSMSKYGVSMDH